MPPQYQNVEFKNFKGLYLTNAPELLGNNELPSCLNFNVGPQGELQKRDGILIGKTGLLSSFPAAPRQPVKVVGLLNQAAMFYNVRAGASDAGAGTGAKTYWTLDNITFNPAVVAGAPDFETDNVYSAVNYLASFAVPSYLHNLLVWNNGTQKFDQIAAAPKTKMDGVLAQDRLFLWDRVNDVLKFSDPGNFAIWPAANFIGTSGDKSETKAIVGYRDKIVIFKLDRIWVLYLAGPPSSWVLKLLPWNRGCTHYNAVRVVDDLIYFVARDGLFRTDLTNMQEVSENIRSVFAVRDNAVYPNYTGGGGDVDYNFLSDSLTHWNKKILLHLREKAGASVGAIGQVYRMFCYNLENSTWSEWKPALPGVTQSFDGFFSSYANPINAAQIQSGLYLGGLDSVGNVYFYKEIGLYGDGVFFALTPFEASFLSKTIDNGAPNDWKRAPIFTARIVGATDNQAVSILIYEVNGSAVTFLNVPTNALNQQIKFKGPRFYRSLELLFSDTSINNIRIEDFTLHVKSKTDMLTDQKT